MGGAPLDREDLHDGDRLRLALEPERGEGLDRRGAAQEVRGGLTGEDRSGRGGRLEPGGGVEDVARERAARRLREVAEEFACFDPDARLERDPVPSRRFQAVEATDEVESRPRRPRGVVLVCRRQAEHPDRAVALRGRNGPPVALDRPACEVVVGTHDRVQDLRVETLRERRGADEVAEQHGDEAAFDRGSGRGGSTRWAEARVGRQRTAARVARHRASL
jgi:hypothetical protein